MELHQARYLVAVVAEGSFTGAGQREHVSQSGISAQVAKLERELGHQLLVRGSRSVALTDAGRAVLPHARAVLAAVAALEATADDLSGLRRGQVALGMVRGCSIPPLLDALASFRATHPGVELTLIEGDSDDLQRGILDGVLDVALIGYAGGPQPGLDVAPVVVEALVAAVGADHPRAAGPLTLAALAAERVLALPVGTGVRTALDRSCARAGVDLVVDLEASSPEAILGLARRGAGVAVVSASMVGDLPLVARPIADAEVAAELGVCTRSGPVSAAATALATVITEAMIA